MNNSESELMDRLPISDILGKEITRGGNSICYENKIDPKQIVLEINSVQEGETDKEALERMKDRLQQEIDLYNQIPNGINAPRITGTKIENNKLYKFMEKAPGVPAQERNSSFEIWKKSLLQLANIPDGHYQKLVSDIKKLYEIGLIVDPSKPDNFYYDEQTGFHLLDLNIGNYDATTDLLDPLVYTFNLFTKYRGQIDQDIKNAIGIIIDKLDNAQANLRKNKIDDIYEVFSRI